MKLVALYLCVGLLVALCVLMLGFALSQVDAPLGWIGSRLG